MTISDRITDALEEFERDHGAPAKLIRLGRAQVAALKRFSDQVLSYDAEDRLGPNFNRIPIEEVDADDCLEVE